MIMDRKLLRFLGFEQRIYEDVVNDSREGFTPEHQNKVKNIINDIIVSSRGD